MTRKGILCLGLSVALALLLVSVLAWNTDGQGPKEQVVPIVHHPTHAELSSTTTGIWHRSQIPDTNKLTVLLWPKRLSQFVDEYSSWDIWLSAQRISAYSPRNELVVSTLALAMLIPDLEIETDEPDSDLVIASGSQAAIGALLERLRDHPLLARVTEDSRTYRDEARTAWAESRLDRIHDAPQHFFVPAINIRNNWVTNVVWGYSLPNATIDITLTRSNSQVLTTTATANTEGLYHAYLAWEIHEGDLVEVRNGTEVEKVSVGPLRVSGDVPGASVMGFALSAPETPQRTTGATLSSLEVTVDGVSRSVQIDSRGMFIADFSDRPFRQGARGFLRYTDGDGNRTFAPFSASIVNVRRDTFHDLPYDSVHSVGISSIVWGNAAPEATLVITLTRSGSLIVTRTVTSDQIGSFVVSLDRLIEDGDVMQVSDGLNIRSVQVPAIVLVQREMEKCPFPIRH